MKAVLNLSDDEFEEVTIVDPHLLREYNGDKLGILDVKVKTRTKKVYEGGEGKYHHRILPCDVDTGYQFTNIKEINILELKKLPTTDDGTNLWAWMKFLTAESKEELDMLVAERPQMKIGKAVARLEELSQDEKARMLYESRQMLEWDIQLGRQQASDSRAVEIAKKLVSLGLSISDISTSTGLPCDDIKHLQPADF